MKIAVLTENTAVRADAAFEHGLSLYIETNRHNILFDMGQTDAFVKNASLLGIDLSQVDIAVISHGHYDHGGGLSHFLRLNSKAPVYLSRYAFGGYYHGPERYIGLDPALKENNQLIFTGDQLIVDEELTFCSCNGCPGKYPLDSAGLSVKQNEDFIPDTFLHEQYLVITEENRRVVFSGCSHKGILNIMDWLHPDILVGGFHFMKQELSDGENPVLQEAAKVLSGYPAVYYTCHCTGIPAYTYLKNKMGGQLFYLASGEVIDI